MPESESCADGERSKCRSDLSPQRRGPVAGGPGEVRACTVAEIFDDPASAQLFAEYAAECANPVIGVKAPERDMYENLEACGLGQCFAVYDGGKLCGFAFVMAGALPYYALRHATVERLFVSREARAKGLGMRLMAAIEDHARKAGCAAISYSAPVGSRLAQLLFLCADQYRNTNHIFCRTLA